MICPDYPTLAPTDTERIREILPTTGARTEIEHMIHTRRTQAHHAPHHPHPPPHHHHPAKTDHNEPTTTHSDPPPPTTNLKS